MGVSTLRPDTKPALPPEDAGVSQWLDALAAGACSQQEFLRNVRDREGDDPEVPWEVLALLDQYLRREKISQEVYASLKARMQQTYMGFGGGTAPAQPPQTMKPAQTVKPTQLAKPEQPAPSPAAAAAPAAPTPSTTVRILASAPISTGPLRVGDVFRGRFQVMDILRKGPSGFLSEAIDQFKVDVPDVSHRVAIEVFDEAARSDPGLLQRICNIQSLAHPGIERIYEVDEDRGALVVIMESLRGVTLSQFVEQDGGRLTLAGAQMIIQSVASALVYAHLHNVFHGDVRAEHVFITDMGEVRLRGFECIARDVPANPKGDRLAFSWFAYELLARLRKSRHVPDDRAHARRPPGVTRDQWRELRKTMIGKEGPWPGVLTAFAGSDSPGSAVFLPDKPRRRRFGPGEWAASAVVAVILAVAGYFVITRGVLTFPQAVAPSAQAVPEPEAVTPAAAEVTIPAVIPKAESVAPPIEVPPAPKYSRALIDLPSETKSVSGDQPVARIWVRRREGLKGEVSFIWWTESGSAKIDQDFREISPRTAIIDDGANGVELLVPLVANPSRDKPRAFYVKIDEPGSNARLGDRTLMQVSIVPPGYTDPEEP